jgi:asparagine synthase (glutamine-hydrolysing)
MRIRTNVQKLFLILNDQTWRVADAQSDCKLLVGRYQALPNHVTKDYLDSIGAPYVYVCHKNDDVEICYINAGIIRPVQIFYKIEDGAAYVSDDIKYLFKNAELDASTLLEFLSFGFVLSDRTLIRNVHILQAGEILEYKNRTLMIQDKYLYDTIPTREEDDKELMEKLWDVAKKVFKDVIKWTKGKTIVVPLSGGLDSRFVVSILKLFGATNVVCVNYGIEGNYETPTSKRVAEKLGYEWHYIDYSLKSQLKMFNSDDFILYLKLTHGYHIAPNIQEFLSTSRFREICDRKDCVFIPGHTGDFISGGHISIDALLSCNIDEIALAILKKHYLRCWPPPENIIIRIIRYLMNLSHEIGNSVGSYQLYEIFDWRERQSKFIVSAIRPYQFFGYQWLMPLWDKRFVDFWAQVPVRFKMFKSLYRKFLSSFVFDPLGVDFEYEGLRRIRETAGYTKNLIKYAASTSRLKFLLQTHGRRCHTYVNPTFIANPCGFDKTYPLFYQQVTKQFASVQNVIECIKQANAIRGYGANPNGYFADALATIMLSDLQFNQKSFISTITSSSKRQEE